MIKKVLFMLMLSALLAACSGGAPALQETETLTPGPSATHTLTPTTTPTRTPTSTPTQTPVPTQAIIEVGPTGFPAGVNPLTGLEVADPELLERKPLATKIQLFPRSGRPPFGINSSDLVWEYYHNGGISRLHAIWYGADEAQIGPIRSARLPDDYLIQMYKSIFAYGSADARINARLFNAPYSPYLVLEGATNVCPPTASAPLCRFDPAGQKLLLSGTAELTEYIRAKNLVNEAPNLEGMRFESEMPAGGEAGEQVGVRYSLDSYNRWEYDPDSGRYVRYQDTRLDDGTGEEYEVLIDRTTEEPVSASNVVVVLADHSYFFRGGGGSEIVDIDLLGSGDAYLFRDGQVYELTWSRLTADAVLTLLDADGNPFPFKPGNTWFQVVGTSSTLTQPEDGAYRFEFKIP